MQTSFYWITTLLIKANDFGGKEYPEYQDDTKREILSHPDDTNLLQDKVEGMVRSSKYLW